MSRNFVYRKNRYRKHKNSNIVFTSVIVVVIFALMAGAVILVSHLIQSNSPAEETSSVPSVEESSVPSQLESSSESPESVPSSEVPVSSESNASSSSSQEEPISSESSDGINVFFEDAVFVGDSRTEGLRLFGVAPTAEFYSSEGLAINTVYTQPVVDANGSKLTVPEALKQNSFSRVYVMFGINELGWPVDSFISRYGAFLDDVKASQPNAQIYVQNIFPVTLNKSNQDSIYNNPNIRVFNERIRQLTQEKGLRYVDLYGAFQDESGNLPVGVSPDGVHLEREYCKKWVRYLADNP